MRRVATEILNYAGRIARKWILLLFLALDGIALLTQALIPQLKLPAWSYALVFIVGLFLAAYQVHNDLLAQLPSKPVEPPAYELLPSSFEVAFSPDVSSIAVWLYAINFQSRELILDTIAVTTLQLSAGPSLDDIPHSATVRIPPKAFREIRCHRPIHNGEVRALRRMEQENPTNATIRVTARAVSGRRTLHYEPPGRTLNGWFSGTPPNLTDAPVAA